MWNIQEIMKVELRENMCIGVLKLEVINIEGSGYKSILVP